MVFIGNWRRDHQEERFLVRLSFDILIFRSGNFQTIEMFNPFLELKYFFLPVSDGNCRSKMLKFNQEVVKFNNVGTLFVMSSFSLKVLSQFRKPPLSPIFYSPIKRMILQHFDSEQKTFSFLICGGITTIVDFVSAKRCQLNVYVFSNFVSNLSYEIFHIIHLFLELSIRFGCLPPWRVSISCQYSNFFS